MLNYLGGTNSNLSANTARTTLTQLAESVRLANTQPQTEVLRAIFTQPGNRTTAPYGTTPTIPGTVVYAANYDQGMNGHAYADTGWENVLFTTGDYTAWNERWTYRNGGVDIETCSDSQSNGYNVGFFKPTEWMKYTINVTATGTYDIALRVANGSGQTSTLQIQSGDGTQTLATASVPNGGWGNWATVTISGGFSTTGVQSIRIANTGSSECNINSIRFTKTSNTIPSTTSVPVSVATVSLKANNGGYLSWQSASPYTLTCEATSETANAQFTLVDAGAGRTALRASNGKYVRYSASDKLYADATTLGSNEQFTLNRLNRSVAIQGPNSLFLTQNANDPVLCSKSILAGWEYFMVTTLSATQGPPAIPLGVAISGGTVSWKSMLGATHYSVQRRTSSGGSSFQTIATDISATSFTDPSPTSGATNSYRIISHAGTYTSQPSAELGFVYSPLPTGWIQQDIGSVGLAGSTTYLDTTFTLKGSGADIEGAADGCHFVSQILSGDFVITARLASMDNTDYRAKAGLMVRETIAANAKYVALLVTPQGGGTRMQWRSTEGGNTSNHELSVRNAPLWLRLVRSGNTITGWQSNDGVTWRDQHAVILPMNSAVQIGLAVTSHKNDTLNTATFQNVDLIALPSGTSSWSSFQNRWFTAPQINDASLRSPKVEEYL